MRRRRLLLFACLLAAQTHAQSGPAAPPATELQTQAQRLVELSFDIQAQLHAMKKYELSIKALRKIDEAGALIRKMRASAPPPATRQP